MSDLLIRVVQVTDTPERVWRAELWSGFPGSSGAACLAGGQHNPPTYTQAQLERDSPSNEKMDLATVQKAIQQDNTQNPYFDEIGERLYELLDQTGVASPWRALIDNGHAAGGAPAVHIRTHLELPPFLEEWPWERLARLANVGLYDRFFFNAGESLLRVTAQTIPNLQWTDAIVRILLVTGQEQLDSSHLASTELWHIRRAFHRAERSVLIEVCDSPARVEELEDKIRSFAPHILHFIGHGDVLPNSDFVLRFAPVDHKAWEWATNRIHAFVRGLRVAPRLVVLNACDAGRNAPHAIALTAALLAAGIPAVVAAQAEVQIEYACHFAEAFYTGLAIRKLTIDRAMTHARQHLSSVAAYQGLPRRHWALPVLTVRAPAEQIVRFKPVTATVRNCELARDVFARPGRFVNRTSDRWGLLSAFCPPVAGDPPFRGVILQGSTPKVGKYWLVKRVLRDFLDGGVMVRYARLTEAGTGRTSLDVLQSWRGSLRYVSPVIGLVPGPHFDDFDAAYLAAQTERSARQIDRVFQTFKQGLQSARGNQKVLLVLDQFRQEERVGVERGDFREHLLEKLLLKLRAVDPPDPELAGVFALLIVRESQTAPFEEKLDFDYFGLNRLSDDLTSEEDRTPDDGFRRIELAEFSSSGADRHFDEFTEFVSEPKGVLKAARSLVRETALLGPWSPQMLHDLERFVNPSLGVPR